MARIPSIRPLIADDASRRLYLRMMAIWASDLLRLRHGPVWPTKDPLADHRDRDWRRLYTGSILDD